MSEVRTAAGIEGPYGDPPEPPDPLEPIEVSSGTLIPYTVNDCSEFYYRFIPKDEAVARERLLRALGVDETS